MDTSPMLAAPAVAAPPMIVRNDPASVVEANGVVPVRAESSAPTPPSNVQKGEVTKSSIAGAEKTEAPDAVEAAERVLKPYGVAMLPDTAKEQEARAAMENAEIA